MAKEVPLKRDSLLKLEKVLNIWKSKNIVEVSRQFTRSRTESVMFLGRKLSRKDIQPNSVEDITITAQRLCEEYIEARLARSGLKGFEQNSTEISEEYSNVLQNMGQILEMKYPRLYTKLSSHLKINYNSEIVVWDSFNKFGNFLFTGGITWAKIIAFYAFTGGLALDSMTHGKNELPGRMVYWFGVFVFKRLASWIKEQGGWTSIVDHFNCGQNEYPECNSDEDFYDDEEQNNLLVQMKTFIEEKRTAIILSAIVIFLLILLVNMIT
ncbi:bcl-2-related ovarian killer protein-like [Clytia hemisphaerica]|uniref:bcl-2-related ovarian killer protein-like n=1 Tax=Clytia hemisphaerica TaxID=252671 RepID=UPI0034D787DF